MHNNIASGKHRTGQLRHPLILPRSAPEQTIHTRPNCKEQCKQGRRRAELHVAQRVCITCHIFNRKLLEEWALDHNHRVLCLTRNNAQERLPGICAQAWMRYYTLCLQAFMLFICAPCLLWWPSSYRRLPTSPSNHTQEDATPCLTTPANSTRSDWTGLDIYLDKGYE